MHQHQVIVLDLIQLSILCDSYLKSFYKNVCSALYCTLLGVLKREYITITLKIYSTVLRSFGSAGSNPVIRMRGLKSYTAVFYLCLTSTKLGVQNKDFCTFRQHFWTHRREIFLASYIFKSVKNDQKKMCGEKTSWRNKGLPHMLLLNSEDQNRTSEDLMNRGQCVEKINCQQW